MKNEIVRLSQDLNKVALDANKGKLNNLNINNGTRLNVRTLNKPSTAWAMKVDDIETPFVVEYDDEEYGKNTALNLMGLFEMRSMLKAFGLPANRQTDYDNKPFLGKKFFVAGTGTGREVINLVALGADVIGIDATKGYVELTAEKLKEITFSPEQNVELFQSLAENFPFENNSLDGLTSLFGVINHIQSWKKQIEKYALALKGNGKLVIEKYGSNNALVFRLKKNSQLNYSPSILQRRDPKGKGILLGDSEEILPANFQSDRQFRFQMEKAGFEVEKKVGFLRIAALFPKQPTSKNIVEFLTLVSKIDKDAYDFLYRFTTPEELLLASFMYDLQSQRRKKKSINIEDFAYVLYVGRKKRPEEFYKFIRR